MEKIAIRALHFDFYGALLTKKQQEIFDLYYQQDLSLGEIAELHKVSRQAIYDLVKRTDQSLKAYENKLGLVAKYQANSEMLEALKMEVSRLKIACPSLDLRVITNLINKLEDNW